MQLEIDAISREAFRDYRAYTQGKSKGIRFKSIFSQIKLFKNSNFQHTQTMMKNGISFICSALYPSKTNDFTHEEVAKFEEILAKVCSKTYHSGYEEADDFEEILKKECGLL